MHDVVSAVCGRRCAVGSLTFGGGGSDGAGGEPGGGGGRNGGLIPPGDSAYWRRVLYLAGMATWAAVAPGAVGVGVAVSLFEGAGLMAAAAFLRGPRT